MLGASWGYVSGTGFFHIFLETLGFQLGFSLRLRRWMRLQLHVSR